MIEILQWISVLLALWLLCGFIATQIMFFIYKKSEDSDWEIENASQFFLILLLGLFTLVVKSYYAIVYLSESKRKMYISKLNSYIKKRNGK